MSTSNKLLGAAEEDNSSRTQQTASVAFQGELGAYSQQAVYSFFGRSSKVVPLPTLQRVFGALCDRNSDLGFAVVPLENSLAGTIGETVDLLTSHDVKIVGETSVPVEHCLIIHRDATLEKIRKVMSHPQALAQCREYLDTKEWEQVSVYDTAGSVKMIREQNLTECAGIASELAAEINGMKVVERGIEDDHSNATRFIVLSRDASVSEPTGQDKTSVIFVTRHEPGALVRALTALASRGVNLGKIESRPIRGKPWDYYFYVDFEGHQKEERCAKAIADLAYQSEELKVLGSYKKRV